MFDSQIWFSISVHLSEVFHPPMQIRKLASQAFIFNDTFCFLFFSENNSGVSSIGWTGETLSFQLSASVKEYKPLGQDERHRETPKA